MIDAATVADPTARLLVAAMTMEQVVAVIEGESRARSLLGRIDRGEADLHELAVMFAAIDERSMIDGAARVIQKRLEEHGDD